jgi:hypothetical protein
MKFKRVTTLLFLFVLVQTSFGNDGLKKGFSIGNPAIKSIKAIAFGPQNILFIGDNTGSMVYAIEVKDTKSSSAIFNIENITEKIGAVMGASAEDIKILDMAVNPVSKNVFFAVSRSNRGLTKNALFILSTKGLQEFPLTNVNFSKIKIKNIPDAGNHKRWKPRQHIITDMHYANGEIIISGLSNEEFSSSLRRVPFPFNKDIVTTNVQVYHVTHKRNESNAPIVRFLPIQLKNEWHVIAGYTCTPLVTFKLNQLNGNKKLVGKTIAEIGTGNIPFGLISYRYKGIGYVLVGNSRYSLTKFTGLDIFNAKELQAPTSDFGIKRQHINFGSIANMSNYNNEYILVIVKDKEGKTFDLKSIPKANI